MKIAVLLANTAFMISALVAGFVYKQKGLSPKIYIGYWILAFFLSGVLIFLYLIL